MPPWPISVPDVPNQQACSLSNPQQPSKKALRHGCHGFCGPGHEVDMRAEERGAPGPAGVNKFHVSCLSRAPIRACRGPLQGSGAG